jgi:hypothetical protein
MKKSFRWRPGTVALREVRKLTSSLRDPRNPASPTVAIKGLITDECGTVRGGQGSTLEELARTLVQNQHYLWLLAVLLAVSSVMLDIASPPDDRHPNEVTTAAYTTYDTSHHPAVLSDYETARLYSSSLIDCSEAAGGVITAGRLTTAWRPAHQGVQVGFPAGTIRLDHRLPPEGTPVDADIGHPTSLSCWLAVVVALLSTQIPRAPRRSSAPPFRRLSGEWYTRATPGIRLGAISRVVAARTVRRSNRRSRLRKTALAPSNPTPPGPVRRRRFTRALMRRIRRSSFRDRRWATNALYDLHTEQHELKMRTPSTPATTCPPAPPRPLQPTPEFSTLSEHDAVPTLEREAVGSGSNGCPSRGRGGRGGGAPAKPATKNPAPAARAPPSAPAGKASPAGVKTERVNPAAAAAAAASPRRQPQPTAEDPSKQAPGESAIKFIERWKQNVCATFITGTCPESASSCARQHWIPPDLDQDMACEFLQLVMGDAGARVAGVRTARERAQDELTDKSNAMLSKLTGDKFKMYSWNPILRMNNEPDGDYMYRLSSWADGTHRGGSWINATRIGPPGIRVMALSLNTTSKYEAAVHALINNCVATKEDMIRTMLVQTYTERASGYLRDLYPCIAATCKHYSKTLQERNSHAALKHPDVSMGRNLPNLGNTCYLTAITGFLRGHLQEEQLGIDVLSDAVYHPSHTSATALLNAMGYDKAVLHYAMCLCVNITHIEFRR